MSRLCGFKTIKLQVSPEQVAVNPNTNMIYVEVGILISSLSPPKNSALGMKDL